MLTDIETGLWSELQSAQPFIDANRRSLQKKWVDNMRMVLKDAAVTPQPGSTSPDLTTTDVPVIIRSHMEKIIQQCKLAAPKAKDSLTLAHIRYVQSKLARLLDPEN